MNLQLPKYKELGQTVIKEWESEHGRRKHQKEEIVNWTKRDDHRHHAIDALIIACTKQGFIQRINTFNASDIKDEMRKEVEQAKIDYNERLTLLEKYLVEQKPFTTAEVMKEAEKILISFKAGKKAATISKYKAVGKNEKTGVIVPRGALHEQSVYGKIKYEDKNKSLKYLFENPEKIINKKVKSLIEDRLRKNGNDVKKAITSLKNNPIYLDDKKEKSLETSSCFKEEYVIKYPLNNLKVKDVPYIVDERIRTIVKERLGKYNGKETEAFKDILWLNEKKQIPILTVRCFTGLSAVQPIKKDQDGKEIGFALTKNNHHIAIYADSNNHYTEHSCTFWHAVERKKNKIPYVIKNTHDLWNGLLEKDLPQSFLEKLPADNLELKFSMQQNEMFILGLSKEEFDQVYKEDNKALLSKYLYFVRKISKGDYWFVHHLETKPTELEKIEGARKSKRYFRVQSIKGLLELNPTKVRINHLGEVTKIGEYLSNNSTVQ